MASPTPMQVLRYVFAVPVVLGAVWVLRKRGQPLKGSVAGGLFCYGVLYLVVFHYWLKAF